MQCICSQFILNLTEIHFFTGDIQELIITKITPSETAAMLTVQPISFDDQRVFLGYQYFYMEAPFQNVSIYENRHGCGYDS